MSTQPPTHEDRTREEAYRLWDEAGRPEGQDQEYWFEAERTLGAAEREQNAKAPVRPSGQMDDNIDDLGRKPDGETLDQPGAVERGSVPR